MIHVTAICLTSYPKRAAMLDNALSSFFEQTLEASEIVIVNDGAPIISLDTRCRVMNIRPGLTLGEKRNLGIATARGWAIAVWDDDDISFESRIADQLQILRSGPVYTRASAMWVSDESMRIKGTLQSASYQTSMITKAAFDLVSGYPALSYLEDMELYIRLVMRGIVRLQSPPPDLFYVYRRHNLQVSTASGETEEKRQYDPDVSGIPEAQARVDRILTLTRRYIEPVYGTLAAR